jgi:hypothetical protein
MSTPTLTPISPGQTVETDEISPFGRCDVVSGTVLEPTDEDLTRGTYEHGDDLEDCVLVEWATGEVRWEYADDLRAA